MKRTKSRLVAVFGLLVASAAHPLWARSITFEERVEAQRAIEQVYWAHRIWPKENPGPKPNLAVVMRDEVIRAKVTDYLRKSVALEIWWKRPITAEQLQAEMDRMARNSRDGKMLRELFHVLGNDGSLIAETLARQTLVERLIRNWYSYDTRMHGELKRKAEAARAACADIACLRSMNGTYREATWKRRLNSADASADETRDDVLLEPDVWADHLERLATRFGTTASSLPTGQLSFLEETPEAFLVTAILAHEEDEMTVTSVTWSKLSFDTWWIAERTTFRSEIEQPSGIFVLPSVSSATCTDDTWNPTRIEPSLRSSRHTAVWTGTEMIVWGGINGPSNGYLNTGSRYNPSTDTWTVTSTGANVPAARSDHTAVWTGAEMIVWGGYNGTPYVNTGGRYNPSTDSWLATSTGTNVPVARSGHTAVWTGAEMIVWGGLSPSYLTTGGRYSPSTNTWLATSTGTNVPDARGIHTAVWTGTEMIVWGGYDGGTYLSTGGRYNPSTDSWLATSTGANVPVGREYHTAVWTGAEMIVWGGAGPFSLNTGGRYNPSTNSWLATSTGANVPTPRLNHTAVWTGAIMIVWAGYDYVSDLNTGGRYHPSTNSWLATSTGANVPDGRINHSAVWTGTEMIAWGGVAVDSGDYLGTGGRYDPLTDTWNATWTAGYAPAGRSGHTAVWTGAEMIIWAGYNGAYLNTGGRYNPTTDSWLATSTGANVPAARQDQTAVWTGTEMIVWGGWGGTAPNIGGRYNPSTDSWLATSNGANVPTGRWSHTAVWTGTEMIVWGGVNGPQVNTGGRYNPSTNTWLATSTGANVPEARYLHTAVWTGAVMIVWGGNNGGPALNTGGRYNPSTDAWTVTSTGANVPAARQAHTAVWTGAEMIVWAGSPNTGGPPYPNTGGRYNPSTNTWLATSTGANAPDGRVSHTAVWTGAEMIVWGGNVNLGAGNTGGRYNPSTDSWVATSTGTNVPATGYGHTAVWTGTEMIVWGGRPGLQYLNTGARYCVCFGLHRDQDGDGFGDPLVSLGCNETYVTDGTDCDDADPTVHPGAADTDCDNVDDNCSGTADEDYVSQPSNTTCGAGVCSRTGSTVCVAGTVQITCTPGPPLGPTDPSCDGVDDNCNGAADEDYAITTSGWLAVRPTGAPSARERHTVTCSSTEALVWGGSASGPSPYQSTGARYNPVTDTWTATTTTGAPDPRRDHRTTWANGEWVVWGGERSNGSVADTGGKFNPGSGTWTATSTSGQNPSARALHSQVWVSSQNRIAIWGGRTGGGETNTGAFYTPSGNNWTSMMSTGAPTARYEHTAVFSGAQNVMIVWGGRTTSGTFFNTGGRYDIIANSWAATSTVGAPSGRTRHTAVWTGTRMIVWGGWNETTHFGDGAAYDPVSNTWTPLPSAGAPSARRDHVAVWTGSKMLVWGGWGPSGSDATGASYDPATNTWAPFDPAGAPLATRDGGGCWLDGPGTLLVWGGNNNGTLLATGGRYTPPTTCGLGICSRQSGSVCSGGVESFGCFPGTPQAEACNRLDDDCDGTADNHVSGNPGTPCLMAGKGGSLLVSSTLSWPSFPGATSYDVVRGLLSSLRSSAGNYTASVDACLANNLAALTATEPSDPPVGGGFWHLLRANLSGGPGTYDEGSPRQVGLRDAEIAAAAATCP